MNLLNQRERVSEGQPSNSLERAREWLGHPRYHPERDLFLAEMDDSPVGYTFLIPELEVGRVVLDGAVHPAHRRRGIGKKLLETAQEQARGLGARLIHIPVPQRMTTARQFLEGEGYVQVRQYWQMRLGGRVEIPPVELNPRFRWRHFVEGDEEELTRIQNLAFAKTWGYCPNTVEDIRYRVNMSFCCPEGIIFIVRGDEVVGYCWTRVEEMGDEETGFIWMMGVVPRLWGLNLGLPVLMGGINYLKGRGVKGIELEVDSQNRSARTLYESVGFRRKSVTLWYEKTLAP